MTISGQKFARRLWNTSPSWADQAQERRHQTASVAVATSSALERPLQPAVGRFGGAALQPHPSQRVRFRRHYLLNLRRQSAKIIGGRRD